MKIGYNLHKPQAAVWVKKISPKRFMIMPEKGIVIIKEGTHVLLMDNDVSILSPDQQKIPPTKQYFITADTIGEFHLVMDM